MVLTFSQRSELSQYEWDAQKKHWTRPDIDKTVLKQLSKRSSLNGLARLAVYFGLLVLSAMITIYIHQFSLVLAIIPLYAYYFLYGFLVAIAHEFQHKTILAKPLEWFGEMIFYIVQALIWNSPRYARISHHLHHRYTMIRGIDPETDWPEVITSTWLKRYLFGLILRILVVGAIYNVFKDIWTQVKRIAGVKDGMMRDHCSPKDISIIRIESFGILAFHTAIVAVAIYWGIWQLLFFITIAWQIGMGIEHLWHQTEHIGRPYNVNDQRLCTRSVKVSPFIKMIYWGLDDHVEHHIFPIVPSRNLPTLHRMLLNYVPEQKNMLACWKEMFAIAREKNHHPDSEYVPLT